MLQNGLSGRLSSRYDSTPSLAIQADLIIDRNVTLGLYCLIGAYRALRWRCLAGAEDSTIAGFLATTLPASNNDRDWDFTSALIGDGSLNYSPAKKWNVLSSSASRAVKRPPTLK
jgi:hypothetical protein